ncbi:Deleted in malignant brain tumors 1 protein [Liparis tanakae]|uniref:Deleted in malignant brain tumors 1 protein n=1 Tax=Liparis tanakae TaxID=230148 RepID=A0A4Z2IZG2_9TELE|nr:Deleted in malignant brain tumors 1 protein [Liparis tanakae]
MLTFLHIPLTGGVRLVDGENKCSGRVEVLRHDQWGTVCDHGWDLREADVVCLELGCGLAELALHGAVFGEGRGEIWLRHVQCSGHESSTLLMPTLTLLSPHTVFSPGEAVRFACNVLLGHHLSDFHLYKHGVSTPLVTQRADQTQTKVELTLSDIETFHQGSYSCQYRIMGGFPSQLLSSPPSNSINITVVEILTPQHWYNTSAEAPAGSVIKGHNFSITCSTRQQYPGGSFQLRLIRSNGTVRQSLPALTPYVTFTFPNAQSSNEGYYYCLYRVQLGGRTFVSRESQPLPIAIRDPDPLLSPMVISWLVSGLTFVVAVVVIIIVAKVLCTKEKKPTELERETRTCVDNTYVALSINKL